MIDILKKFPIHKLIQALPILLVLACDNALRREHEVFREDDTAVEVGREVEILYSDSAQLRVRVTAPVLHNYTERDNPRQEFPAGIKIDFYDQNAHIRSTLTAKNAIRFQEKGQVIVRDSVVLSTVEREKLETEELIWDEKTEKITTEKFVKITKPGEVIYGFGLDANQDFSYWKIRVPKGRIKVEQMDEALR